MEDGMEQLLALRLADLTRPVNVGIIGPSDTNPVLRAAWQSGQVKLTVKEVMQLGEPDSTNVLP